MEAEPPAEQRGRVSRGLARRRIARVDVDDTAALSSSRSSSDLQAGDPGRGGLGECTSLGGTDCSMRFALGLMPICTKPNLAAGKMSWANSFRRPRITNYRSRRQPAGSCSPGRPKEAQPASEPLRPLGLGGQFAGRGETLDLHGAGGHRTGGRPHLLGGGSTAIGPPDKAYLWSATEDPSQKGEAGWSLGDPRPC